MPTIVKVAIAQLTDIISIFSGSDRCFFLDLIPRKSAVCYLCECFRPTLSTQRQ
ncbi:hypothetical protein [aff. Roholtiella sp. LEGE 12411]|uniref:hypothetical protein n=1 Tax=aff. Roholtiella sp. LEGE 12411 TaxID=1828822 RepID=UPI0030DD5FF1